MYKYMVRYRKCGDAKYISHLDFLRSIQRAMRRAELPLKFSEGFNPHPCLAFAHPLGVGIAGERELFEVVLTEECETIVERLSPKMPRGIEIIEATPCEKNNFAAVARAVYAVCPENLPDAEKIERFLALPEIQIEKRTKSGVKMADIRPDIFGIWQEGDTLFLRISAGSQANVKPSTVLEAMAAYLPDYTPGFCRYTRLMLTDEEDRPI